MKRFILIFTLLVGLTGMANAAGVLSAVYLNPSDGNDSNSGAASVYPVRTWGEAISLAAVNATIYVTGSSVSISSNMIIDGNQHGANNITVMPLSGYTGALFTILGGGTGTFSNITLKGAGPAQILLSVNGGGTLTIGSNMDIIDGGQISLDGAANPINLTATPSSLTLYPLLTSYSNASDEGRAIVNAGSITTPTQFFNLVTPATNAQVGYELALDGSTIRLYELAIGGIYFDPANGNDAYSGAKSNRPVKTLAHAKTKWNSRNLAVPGTVTDIYILSPLTLTANTTLDGGIKITRFPGDSDRSTALMSNMIVYTGYILNLEDITVDNGSTNGIAFYSASNGTLNLNNGAAITSNNAYIIIQTLYSGNTTMNDGSSITATYTGTGSGVYCINSSANSTVTLNGGTINSSINVFDISSSSIFFEGTTINHTGANLFMNCYQGTVVFNGGTVTTAGANAFGLSLSPFTMNGGTITSTRTSATNLINSSSANSPVIINDGTINGGLSTALYLGSTGNTLRLVKGKITSSNSVSGTIYTSSLIHLNAEDVEIVGVINMATVNLDANYINVTSATVANNYDVRIANGAEYTALVRSSPEIDLGPYLNNFTLEYKQGYALTAYANKGEALRNLVLYDMSGVYVNDFTGDDSNTGLSPALPLKTLAAAAGKTVSDPNLRTIYICDSTLTINSNQYLMQPVAKDTISTYMFRRSAHMMRVTSGNTLTMGNIAVYHRIQNALVSGYINVSDGATLTLNSGASLFLNNTQKICINQTGGTVTMNNGSLISNIPNSVATTNNGYGIYQNGSNVTPPPTANINNGAIIERIGYGIQSSIANGIFNINNGAIIQYCPRSAVSMGAGTVYVNEAIIQNNATSGANYYAIVVSNGTMYINGAIIQNNSYCALNITGSGAVVHMTDGQIINNTNSSSGYYGFVRVQSQATFNFSGGLIGRNTPNASANYPIYGDQVYISNGGKMNFTGGRIVGTGEDKNAVYVMSSGSTSTYASHLKLSDAAVIDSGYIYCESPYFAPLSLSGPLNSSKRFSINLGDNMAGCVLVDGSTVRAELINFDLNRELIILSLSQSGDNVVVGASAVYLNGATGSDALDGSSSANAVRTFAMARTRLQASGGNYIIVVGAANLSNAGETSDWNLNFNSDAVVMRGLGYSGYLVNVTGRSVTFSDITLDGNKANMNTTVSAIVYGSSSTIGINGGTKIKNNNSNGVETYTCRIKIDGGEITDNKGFGVSVSNGKIFMNGGIIANNDTTGIYLQSGERADSLVMTGGSIRNNSGHGIYCNNSRRYLLITGGEICENNSGGLVSNNNSTYIGLLKIGGTTKINNNNSHGVHIYYLDSLIVEGGQINNNNGYGINSGSNTRNVLITGGEIKNNTGFGLNVAGITNAVVGSGNTMRLSNLNITGNGSGGVNVSNYDTCSISRDTINNNGFGINIQNCSNVLFKNVEVKSNNGYGITVANSNVNIPGTTLIEDVNSELNNGYGISLTGTNSYDLSNNINITQNKSSGIYSNTTLTSTISGDLNISGNKATAGGGIYVVTGNVNITGNLTLTADTCTSNNGGGGIYVNTNGNVVITGEMQIIDCVNTNTSSGASYGGSAIYALGRLSMTGGLITGCSTTLNGTVFVSGTSSDVRLTGVKIENNTAAQGGSIYINTGGKITLDRDTIINNTTTNFSYSNLTTGDIHIAGDNTGRLSLRDRNVIDSDIFINSTRDIIIVDESLQSSSVGAFRLLANSTGTGINLVTRPGTVVVSPNGSTVTDASQFLTRFTLVNQNIGRGLDKGGTEEKHIIIVNQFFIDGTKPAGGNGANPLAAFNNINQMVGASALSSAYSTVWVSGPVTTTGNDVIPSITTNNVNIRRYTGFAVAAQPFTAYDSVMFTINPGGSLIITGGNTVTNNFTLSGEGGSALTDASILKNNGTLTIGGNTTLFFNPTGGNGSAIYQNGTFNMSGRVEFNTYSSNTVYLPENKIINITGPFIGTRSVGLTVETSPVNTHVSARVLVSGTAANVPASMLNLFHNEISPDPLPIGRVVDGSNADLVFYIADRNIGATPPIYFSLQDAFDAAISANNDEVRLYGNIKESIIVNKTLRYNSKGHNVDGSFILDSTSNVQLLDNLHADTLFIRASTFSKKTQLDLNGYDATVTKAAYLDLRLPEDINVGDWYPINLPFNADISEIKDASDTTMSLFYMADFFIAEYDGLRRAIHGIGNMPTNPNNDWQYFQGATMNNGTGYMVSTRGLQTLRFKASNLNLFSTTTAPVTYHTGGAGISHSGMNYVAQPTSMNATIGGDMPAGAIIQVSESLSSDRIGATSYIPKTVGPSLVVAPYTNYFYQTPIDRTMSYTKTSTSAEVRSGKVSEVPAYYELRFRVENAERYDALFVATSEYASKDRYEVGRDVVKMGTVGNAAQIWSKDFDVPLCANEVRLENGYADIPLFINTPVIGKEYKLNLENVVSYSEQLWLCRGGKSLQNMTLYPEYIIEGTGGTDEYSLRLLTGMTGNDPFGVENIYVYTENKTIVIAGLLAEDEYQVFDMSGRLVAQSKANSNRVKIPAPSGAYIVLVNGKSLKAVVK